MEAQSSCNAEKRKKARLLRTRDNGVIFWRHSCVARAGQIAYTSSHGWLTKSAGGRDVYALLQRVSERSSVPTGKISLQGTLQKSSDFPRKKDVTEWITSVRTHLRIVVTEECRFISKELREFRLLTPSGRGRFFKHFLPHKFTHLSR